MQRTFERICGAAKAGNVSFKTLLRWLIYVITSVNNNKSS